MLPGLAKKLGLKDGRRAVFLRAPTEVKDAARAAGAVVAGKLAGMFDWMFVCLKRKTVLKRDFPRLKKHLRNPGMLWISWPKKGLLETDLTMGEIIKIGYDNGLVESKCVSVNASWSAIKFTYPKEGKVYRNSFGRLKR